MSLACAVRETYRDELSAITHIDGTARLHTVSEKDNKWYHGFISKWFKK